MRISDELMWRYLELLSAEDMETINRWRREVAEGINPMEIKMRLASEIVTRYHGAKAAEHAREHFATVSQRGEVPADIPVRDVPTSTAGLTVMQAMKAAELTTSTSEAIRLIKQGAVAIDGERVKDPRQELTAGADVVFKVGKRRFARVRVVKS